MFCSNCGKPVSRNANFCKFCGEKLSEYNTSNETNNKVFVIPFDKKFLKIICIIFTIILNIVVLYNLPYEYGFGLFGAILLTISIKNFLAKSLVYGYFWGIITLLLFIGITIINIKTLIFSIMDFVLLLGIFLPMGFIKRQIIK